MMMFKFGHNRSHFSAMINKERIALHNLLLKGWDADWETLPYPPAQGHFAVYNKESFKETVEYAIKSFYNLQEDSLSVVLNFSWDNHTVKVNVTSFGTVVGKPTDEYFDTPFEEAYFEVTRDQIYDENNTFLGYDIDKDFRRHDIYLGFYSTTLSFNIFSLKIFTEVGEALCIESEVKIVFDNHDNTGQVVVNMLIKSNKVSCMSQGFPFKDWSLKNASVDLGTPVIFVGSIGLCCTITDFIFGVIVLLKTKQFMKRFFKHYYKPEDSAETDLPIEEYFRFVSIWNICMMLSEIFTLYGTIRIIYKPEETSIGLEELDSFITILGCGCFLSWISVLRIVRFHRKFRILLSTVWLAASDVFAYLLCVGIMFFGYFVVGYVVLGPYNFKFSTPTQSLETLSALVTGDEIYTTMNITECEEYGVIWWFSRVYLWSYIASFTVIILNLLIAILMSAYDSIKGKDAQKDTGPDIGPLEIALRDILNSKTDDEFRKSVCDLITSSQHFDSTDSAENIALKLQFCRVCRASTEGAKVIVKQPRTLKALMREYEDLTSFTCFGIQFAFVIVFRRFRKSFEMNETI